MFCACASKFDPLSFGHFFPLKLQRHRGRLVAECPQGTTCIHEVDSHVHVERAVQSARKNMPSCCHDKLHEHQAWFQATYLLHPFRQEVLKSAPVFGDMAKLQANEEFVPSTKEEQQADSLHTEATRLFRENR